MKRALVTGGRKGIGAVIVDRLLERGLAVTVLTRSGGGSERANCEYVEFQLEQVSAIPALIERLGSFDVLVNNAGMMNAIAIESWRSICSHRSS
jgi:3-oxoacyl-[acyl-carrier protein] reductase